MQLTVRANVTYALYRGRSKGRCACLNPSIKDMKYQVPIYTAMALGTSEALKAVKGYQSQQ